MPPISVWPVQYEEVPQPEPEVNEEDEGEDAEEKKVEPQYVRVLTDSEKLLQNKELDDYLKNKGQWDISLVSGNKPNIEAFLTGQTEGAPAPVKGKAPAKQAADAIVLEPGDADLTDEPENNFYLGDAVE